MGLFKGAKEILAIAGDYCAVVDRRADSIIKRHGGSPVCVYAFLKQLMDFKENEAC